ncbi:hypothetical protein BS50DRAFT_569588 [Corynespora cassiicola Philippines]|uniref:Thioesterase domain-containing protein n=1 Tax=Corynespora cassiicola Philippines TaxID=1448308 RepID=A0A2T2P2V0_CORCC|nr:hypothetical protein BS50DRAFT_569588 [Corynespora cassiicola Philippines]
MSEIDAAVAHFRPVPWAAAILDDSAWTPTSSETRTVKPGTTEDSFIAQTAKTDRTIRAYVTLRPSQADDDQETAYKQLRTLVDIGDGLDGHPRVLHGGFVATLLDEVCGMIVTLNLDKKTERLREAGLTVPHRGAYLTAYLNTSYKRPVPTPGPLLCTSWIEKRERNKVYVKGTIEDGRGTIYALGDAMFVEFKGKL